MVYPGNFVYISQVVWAAYHLSTSANQNVATFCMEYWKSDGHVFLTSYSTAMEGRSGRFSVTKWCTFVDEGLLIAFIHRYSLFWSRHIVLVSHVVLNEWLYLFYNVSKRIKKSPEWCTDSPVWLIHVWCHVKLVHLGTSSVYTIQACISLQCHFIQSDIGRAHVCSAVTCHLHCLAEWLGPCWCYCGKTEGGTDTEIRINTGRRPGRRKFSHCSCGDLNPGHFNHKSGTLTIELSLLPCDMRQMATIKWGKF